ncbi:hypothetical protein K7X08_034354 [Anisodus acutangulus]|uniref:Uncharacterized protein n=1 Tax=Anisodus acutangulus TaxID=402998 RepID=A0A9Q1R1J8_9SOLA|nr:hypothetical protein K7X08_034354 [Anisodus acutangulus]
MEDFPNVSAYCKRLKELADQLRNVGVPVSNDRLVLQMVSGLFEAYSGVGTLLRQSNPLPQFYQIRSMLTLEEADMAKTVATGASPVVMMTESIVHPTGSNNSGQNRNNDVDKKVGNKKNNGKNRGGNNVGSRTSGGGSGGPHSGQQQQQFWAPQWANSFQPHWQWAVQQQSRPNMTWPTFSKSYGPRQQAWDFKTESPLMRCDSRGFQVPIYRVKSCRQRLQPLLLPCGMLVLVIRGRLFCLP